MSYLLQRAEQVANDAHNPVINRGDHSTCDIVDKLATIVVELVKKLEEKESK